MRKLSGNRKAISPVLSTILLILIVVLGMSVAFGYFVSFVRDYQAGRGGSVMELISVEDVWFKPDHTTIEIWLYNYGKVEAKINALYVNGTQLNFDPNPIQIPVGKHNNTVAYPTNGWADDAVYNFKIVTERGSAVEAKYPSPNT